MLRRNTDLFLSLISRLELLRLPRPVRRRQALQHLRGLQQQRQQLQQRQLRLSGKQEVKKTNRDTGRQLPNMRIFWTMILIKCFCIIQRPYTRRIKNVDWIPGGLYGKHLFLIITFHTSKHHTFNKFRSQIQYSFNFLSYLLFFFPIVIPLFELLMRPVMMTPLRIPAPSRRAERVSSPLCRWRYSSSSAKKTTFQILRNVFVEIFKPTNLLETRTVFTDLKRTRHRLRIRGQSFQIFMTIFLRSLNSIWPTNLPEQLFKSWGKFSW